MKASHARKKLEMIRQAEKSQERKQKREQRIKTVEVVNQALKDFKTIYIPEVLKDINESIENKKTETNYYTSKSGLGAVYDYAYLKAISEQLLAYLKKNKYRCKILELESKYATIYEGLMNPEAVGHEYCRVVLIMEISWGDT